MSADLCCVFIIYYTLYFLISVIHLAKKKNYII